MALTAKEAVENLRRLGGICARQKEIDVAFDALVSEARDILASWADPTHLTFSVEKAQFVREVFLMLASNVHVEIQNK